MYRLYSVNEPRTAAMKQAYALFAGLLSKSAHVATDSVSEPPFGRLIYRVQMQGVS